MVMCRMEVCGGRPLEIVEFAFAVGNENMV